MIAHRFADPPRMPDTGEAPAERMARAGPLPGTPGQAYVERRGVPLHVAEAAGLRFDADWGGRAAVLVPMRDQDGALTAVHGRYLQTVRGQLKMLTVGAGGGVVDVLNGWRDEPLILVEGAFDALSLAVCGWSSVATLGRWAPWLAQTTARRVVWLGFDANRPGEHEAARYVKWLPEATVHRLLPPPRCKDWSTALVKQGRGAVTRWLRAGLGVGDTTVG